MHVQSSRSEGPPGYHAPFQEVDLGGHMMRTVTVRERWFVGIAGVTLLALGFVSWATFGLHRESATERPQKTWVADAGTTLTVQSEDLHLGDRFGCRGPSVKAPEVALSNWVPGGTVRTAGDGSVSLRCYEGTNAGT
jgi:hypothetical protein